MDVLRNCVSVGLDQLEVLVLDEADRLLELGFKARMRHRPLALAMMRMPCCCADHHPLQAIAIG